MQTPISARAVLLFLLSCSVFIHAQSHVLTLPPPEKPMTVQDVIKLSKAGYSDDLIIEQIKKKLQHFDLTTNQLLQLKTARVSERVVKYMIDPASAVAAPCTSAATSKANPASQSTTNSEAKDHDAVPTDVGIYVRQNGEWTAMLAELVNWKSQGTLKTAATLSFVNGDQSGIVDGPMSRNHFTSPLEFLIVMPEGVTITGYQLVRLHRRGEERDFRIATGGIAHASNDAGRDMMVFNPVRLSPSAYTVELKVYAGEYGFLPPDSVTARNDAALAKIFTFRIME